MYECYNDNNFMCHTYFAYCKNGSRIKQMERDKKMTKEEYEKTLIRLFDSLREEKYRSEKSCNGVDCADCPFNQDNICIDFDSVSRALKQLKIIEEWDKAHPIVTNADKFEEIFGCIPMDDDCEYPCPLSFGFYKDKSEQNLCGVTGDISCAECAAKFWESKYIKPKGE